MNRFSRISTIWRKELIDTLRDRRTLIAMVLVPLVLYPALMLGSLQALEVQVSQLVTEEYTVAVPSQEVQTWLRQVLDADAAQQAAPAQSMAPAPEAPASAPHSPWTRFEPAVQNKPSLKDRGMRGARGDVRGRPPPYRIILVDDIRAAVAAGRAQAGVVVEGPLPRLGGEGSTRIGLAYDESDVRSDIAAAGLKGVLERAAEQMLRQRLSARGLGVEFVVPIEMVEENVATAERMAGAVLGQIVPLILIIMTITGAIYPAIDLTAGERERGTLETLMAAPVPTADLVAGKFVVVTLIGLLSAVLNLLSIGGTIYLGGVGAVISPGSEAAVPLQALPWVLLLLVPLAVMFSAVLLAVCSFARSFKEAQNYIVPVMVAAMIPGVVGILPGTRLEGPIIVMPVANIVVLTRELFLGKFDLEAIVWVLLSTSLYAGAAIAIAAKLFGQEAVLFADAGSVRTLFLRRFFRPSAAPSAAQALLLLTVVYSLNFFIQQAIGQSPLLSHGMPFLMSVAAALVVLMGAGPFGVARYMKVEAGSAFALRWPHWGAWVAALCLGGSTWILARNWLGLQQRWLPMDPQVFQQIQSQSAWMDQMPIWPLVVFLALIPALCEELFFRGYVLSGLQRSIGRGAAVLTSALAFGLFHYTAHRFLVAAALGLLLALLVVQYRSIWPAMLAHFLHNAVTQTADREDGLKPLLERLGYVADAHGVPAPAWALGAGVAALIGVLVCAFAPARNDALHRSATAGVR